MKKLLNPRGYLSPSQIDLWERNPTKYIQQYFYGEKQVTNRRMEYGSKVALAEENGEETDDELINMLVALLPKYPKHEHIMRVTFQSSNGAVDLLGKLDKFDDKTLAFRDTKTGTTKWTAKMAQKHQQLHHYAAMIWLEYKKLPPKIHIDWAQTAVDEYGTPTLTGQIMTFEVKITLQDVLSYLAKVSRVASEIDKAYRAELKI